MPARVLLFGSAILGERDGGWPLPADRRGTLLAYLASDGGWVDRDRLAVLFWPDTDEESAKRNLRQLLLRTKRLPLEPALLTSVEAVRWPVDSDVGQFRRALAVADHARAAALYQGPFLDGFVLADLAAAGAWLDSERERLHAAFHGAALREAAALAGRGALDEAQRLLERLLQFDEFAEDVASAYIRVLAWAGRREAAIEAYRRFEKALDEELGLEPLDATRELIAAVASGERPGAGESDAQTPVTLPGPLRTPRLVGRDAARQALRGSSATLVVVAGAPGVGKSRLLRECLPEAAFCAAHEGLEQVSYHPLSSLVRERPAAAERLGPYLEDLARLVPEVAPGLEPAPIDPELAKGRLAEALARFAAAAGSQLVIDDLQWADKATLETIHYLTEHGHRVYASYRSTEVGPALAELLAVFAAKGELQTIELGELTEQDVSDLLADLMGRASGPPTFSSWLWSRSSGNPMFVLESLRSLFETGSLRVAGEQWSTEVDELTKDYSELDIPPLVSQVIVRRLSRLSPAGRRVLEIVAVTRSASDPKSIAAAAELPVGAAADALDECMRAGFLTTTDFRHDLLRQSVYDEIDPTRKRLLHALAGAQLLTRERPELAAEHLLFAGDSEQARLAWSRHVSDLRSRGLLADAITVLRSAVTRLPEGEEAAVDAAWLRLQLVDTLRESDRLEEATHELTNVDLPASSSPELRLRYLHAEVALRLQSGLVTEADELLKRARGLTALVDDDELLIDDVMFRARVARDQLRIADAVALIEPTVERLRQSRPDVRSIQFITSLAVLNDDLGDFDKALALHQEALDLAKALGSRYFQVEAALNLVICLQSLERFDEATTLAEEMLLLGDYQGDYDNVPLLRINLASTYYAEGRFDDALRHYRQLISRTEPHLRLIALGRCAECLAALSGARDDSAGSDESDPEREISLHLDGALELLATAEYGPAIGRAVIATLNHGSESQRRRLREIRPTIDPAALPGYLQEELERALSATGEPPVPLQPDR